MESGHSMNSWNGGAEAGRLGALSWSWSLGQKPGCSHTAFVCPASGSNAMALVDSKGEGEGLGSLEISECKSGPHGAHLGHYLKGTVGEQEQMGHQTQLMAFHM